MPSGYSWGHFCYENKLKKSLKIFLFQIIVVSLTHRKQQSNRINLIKMKKLIAYTIEMHKQDPECIPLAIGIIVMGFIGFIVFSAIILS